MSYALIPFLLCISAKRQISPCRLQWPPNTHLRQYAHLSMSLSCDTPVHKSPRDDSLPWPRMFISPVPVFRKSVAGLLSTFLTAADNAWNSSSSSVHLQRLHTSLTVAFTVTFRLSQLDTLRLSSLRCLKNLNEVNVKGYVISINISPLKRYFRQLALPQPLSLRQR